MARAGTAAYSDRGRSVHGRVRARGRRGLLGIGVDAIFCGNNATAEGASRASARHLSVPGDVALAGFDDVRFAAALDPPLTTIRQGVQEQGAEATRTLSTCCGIGETDLAGHPADRTGDPPFDHRRDEGGRPP